MPPVKPLSRISDKWARQSANSQSEYVAGVTNPKADWANQTIAAEGNYDRGVQQAITAKRFGKGVRRRGTSFWQERTLTKGPSRWAEGIQVSQDAYEKGFAPYRDIIEKTTLPERGPKGDPKNIQRVGVLAAALHKGKLARAGA